MKIKKIVLAGGSGFLGDTILQHFEKSETEIVVLTRNKSKASNKIRYVNWDGEQLGTWTIELENADVLINLTGKSVDCRYTESNKGEIIRSRVSATTILTAAIQGLKNPPKVWMNAASATIYRNAEDRAMDEFDGEIGEGFSVEVCKIWEDTFNKAIVPKTRKITLRISMVLGKSGGVIPVLKKLVQNGLGGKMGNGKQYISWIHADDFVNGLLWLIEHEDLNGAFNLASPNPITNDSFMQMMRTIQHKSFGLPASKWMLEIGAFFLRTETELILKSRRVVPTKLLQSGFQFHFPEAEVALKNLL